MRSRHRSLAAARLLAALLSRRPWPGRAADGDLGARSRRRRPGAHDRGDRSARVGRDRVDRSPLDPRHLGVQDRVPRARGQGGARRRAGGRFRHGRPRTPSHRAADEGGTRRAAARQDPRRPRARGRRRSKLAAAEAESRLGKARLEAEAPAELVAHRDLERARLRLADAEREAAYRQRGDRAARRADRGGARGARRRARRRAGAVAELEAAIARMRVAAPRDGTVVYVTDWRGEKKKVGDPAWHGQAVLELPRLDRLRGTDRGAGVGRRPARGGQRVRLRLDSRPDREYLGDGRPGQPDRRARSRARTPGAWSAREIELDRGRRRGDATGDALPGAAGARARSAACWLVPQAALATPRRADRRRAPALDRRGDGGARAGAVRRRAGGGPLGARGGGPRPSRRRGAGGERLVSRGGIALALAVGAALGACARPPEVPTTRVEERRVPARRSSPRVTSRRRSRPRSRRRPTSIEALRLNWIVADGTPVAAAR